MGARAAEGQDTVGMLMNPDVVAAYAGHVDPARQLDERRARAVARLLDELRRAARLAAMARGTDAA